MLLGGVEVYDGLSVSWWKFNNCSQRSLDSAYRRVRQRWRFQGLYHGNISMIDCWYIWCYGCQIR